MSREPGRRFHLTMVLTAAGALMGSVQADTRTPVDDPMDLQSIVTRVRADRIEADIRALVGFGTRHTLSATDSEKRGIGAARRWIEAEFRRTSAVCGGCLTVVTQSETVSGRRIPTPTEVVNVLAIQRGESEPDRYVIMSGDIDSRVSDPLDARADSPGANDNASGMAGVLEAARVLTRYRFPATIVYVGLSGEEQGLYGGAIMARAASAQGWAIQAVLNNDMIGNIEGVNGVIDNATARVFSEGTRMAETEEEARQRRYTGGEVDSASRNLARFIDLMADRYIPNLDVMLVYRLDRFGRGGHHLPFNEAGYPAVRIMETNENYRRQHQDIREEGGVAYGDVIAGVNFPYAAKLTALNAVSLAAMAAAPAPPDAVSIEGAVQPDTRLQWQAVPGAAGYRIYWRETSAPTWTHHRDAGDVTEATLDNLVIDNYFFGVSSVGTGGLESPVVFPGPAGDFFRD
ncbi:MAG: M28 family metallopeptidase [Pseudomonadales bacterium]